MINGRINIEDNDPKLLDELNKLTMMHKKWADKKAEDKDFFLLKAIASVVQEAKALAFFFEEIIALNKSAADLEKTQLEIQVAAKEEWHRREEFSSTKSLRLQMEQLLSAEEVIKKLAAIEQQITQQQESIREEIRKNWKADTWSEGLERQVNDLINSSESNSINNITANFAKINEQLLTDLEKKQLNEKLSQRIIELREKLLLTTAATDPHAAMMMYIKFTGLARDFLNDVRTFYTELNKDRSLDNQLLLPEISVKQLVNFAEKNCGVTIDQFMAKIKGFLEETSKLNALEQQRLSIQTEKAHLEKNTVILSSQTLAAQEKYGVRLKTFPEVAFYDADAGTVYARQINAINAQVFMQHAANVLNNQYNLSRLVIKDGWPNILFSMDEKTSFYFNKLTQEFTLLEGNEATIKAMVLFCNKVYPNNALQVIVPDEASLHKIKQLYENIDNNIAFEIKPLLFDNYQDIEHNKRERANEMLANSLPNAPRGPQR